MPRAFTAAESASITQSLLRAGAAAMAQGGLRRTPVVHLCRSAGISKGAFYRFFESKEALAVALLQQAEKELRTQISERVADRTTTAEECLQGVLSLVFESVQHHPLLHALSDPEEFAWLARGMGEEAMAEAQADDDRWFAAVFTQLEERNAVGQHVSVEAFCGLPAAALALAQQRALIGEGRADVVQALIIDGLVATMCAGVQRDQASRTGQG